MADPFDVVGTGGGSFLGQNASFWRNLLAFGASTLAAANARTPQGFLAYGPGAVGALGAGALGAMQTDRQNAQMQSELGLRQAQAGNLAADTQLKQFQIPFAKAKMGMIQNIMSGGGPMAPDGGGGAGAGSGGGGDVIPPAQRQGLLQAAVSGTPVPPTVLDAVVQHESGWNPKATGTAGDIGLGQVLPSTAQNPGYGMAGVQPASLSDPAANLRFTAQYLYARGKDAGLQDADWSDPSKVQAALAGYHSGVDNPRYVRQVMANLQAGPSWAQPAGAAAQPAAPDQSAGSGVAGMPTPQLAMAQADALTRRAAQLRMVGLDATPIEQQAQQLRTFALTAQGQNYQYHSLRGPGSVLTGPGGRPIVQVPERVDRVDPATGAVSHDFIEPLPGATGASAAPAVAGAAPGTVASVPAKLGPGQEKIISGLAEGYAGGGKKQYDSAVATLGWAEQMSHALDVLNSGGGWSVTGAGNQGRMEIAKGINGLSQVLGVAPPFDPMKVSSWEEFNKQTKTAGMQLVNQNFGGSREAASIIQSATSAVPNSENTPQGGKLVLNAIVESARNVMDKRIFETNWAGQHGGNLQGADEAFNQRFPPSMYARRAISQAQPYKVTSPDQMKRYLPGTHVITPDGQVRVIPGAESLTLAGGGAGPLQGGG